MKNILTGIKNGTRENDRAMLQVFSERFNALFAETGMTQAEFAKLFGIKAAAVGKYANGVGFPSMSVLADIARYFNVTVDFLLGSDQRPCGIDEIIYFQNKGEFQYDFGMDPETNKELRGSLSYVFGLNVLDINDYRERKGEFPFICFDFEDTQEHLTLLKALFYTHTIDFAYFVLQVNAQLGIRLAGMHSQDAKRDQLFNSRILVSAKRGIPTDEFFKKFYDEQCTAVDIGSLIEGKAYLGLPPTAGVTGVVEQWKAFSDKEQHEFLMNYLTRYKQ